MYQIQKKINNIVKLKECSFSELGFKERDNLQEWIAKNPDALGEELLIIQKEFAGFDDTKERLDLLALDKQGNIVIIENKLDDSGRDVTWQALKYVSYCSSLSSSQIVNIYQDYLHKSGIDESAEDKLVEFFESDNIDEISLNPGTKQRMILIAANFRKEVTSTVLWLLNYNIRIQCIKVKPFSLGEELFLNFEQILPVKEIEDYAISLAEKNRSDIVTQEKNKKSSLMRERFWTGFLEYSNSKSDLFSSLNPTKDVWLGKGIGIGGISLSIVATGKFARTEIYFNLGTKELNKALFDFVMKSKEKYEADFGASLVWERMSEKVTCRIKDQNDSFNVYDEEQWQRMYEFLFDSSQRLHATFTKDAKKLSGHIKKLKGIKRS